MIANTCNGFGVWNLRGVSIVRRRGEWTAHFEGDDALLCSKRIAPKERITRPTFVLDTCGKCRKEYVAKYL